MLTVGCIEPCAVYSADASSEFASPGPRQRGSSDTWWRGVRMERRDSSQGSRLTQNNLPRRSFVGAMGALLLAGPQALQAAGLPGLSNGSLAGGTVPLVGVSALEAHGAALGASNEAPTRQE